MAVPRFFSTIQVKHKGGSSRYLGSVEKGGEIFLINIFFFPLYHGRKIFISVSRIRFTQ